MSKNTSDYALPNLPTKRCIDRFSILNDADEDENGLVSLWDLLQKVLETEIQNSTEVVNVLESISYSLRGSSGVAGDYGGLKSVVNELGDGFISQTWPIIKRLALQLPLLFPSGTLPILKSGDELVLSREQVAALVAHQFLCTLDGPPWRSEFFDFSIWYNSSQRHPKAVEMYLNALFTYFDHVEAIVGQSDLHDTTVRYAIHSCDAGYPDISQDLWELNLPLERVKIIHLKTHSTEGQEVEHQGINNAVVVSANKDVGFGQSATQEEIYMGNCPEACPAVLVTPTLVSNQVLVIEGSRPMLRIQGQRRNITWSYLVPQPRNGGRMLFMDALELDEMSAETKGGLADLELDNMKRELVKAYTAFSSWSKTPEPEAGNNSIVWTGLWGCGAFNGDPAVKMTLLWMAASLAGVQLRILCDEPDHDFAVLYERFILQMANVTVADLKDRLLDIAKTTKRKETMQFLLDK